MNVTQFTLRDITVNVVPGVVLLVLLASLTPLTTFDRIVAAGLDGGVFAALILLILSYAAGRSFQEGVSRMIDDFISGISRSNMYQPAIQYFRQEMDKAREENHPTARRLFLEEALTHFSGESADSIEDVERRPDDFDLFNICQEYVIGNEIGRTNRFRILSRFHRSMYVIALLGIIGHVVAQFAWPSLGYEPALGLTHFLFVIIILGIVGVISFTERWYFERKFVDSLMHSFYAAMADS